MKRRVQDEHAAGRSGARSVAPLRVAMAVWLGVSSSTLLLATPAMASDNLVLDPDWPLLGGLLVGFVILIFPVNQLIFKPIFQALDERTARIDGAKTRASQIERDADAILSQYEERIRDARDDAEQDRKAQTAAAREEQGLLTDAARNDAEQKIEQARAALSGEVDTARDALRTSARGLAQSAAEQILGRDVS